MPDIKVSTTSQLRLRAPTTNDAADIWQLVGDSGVLDRNSSYLYLVLCRDFAKTCLVAETVADAETDSRIVGFVTGYRPPERLAVLFVWQVAVCPSAQGQGLGLELLSELVHRAQDDHATEYVEATVAPSNTISRRLFRTLANGLDAELTEATGFEESDFPPGDHESEPVIRIGPLPKFL